VFCGIGTPCNGRNCEFSPGGVKVSCPAASGPDSLKVNESGIMTGTCNDGIDNDCDGKVDANDPQCGFVQNCNASLHTGGEECQGIPEDLGDQNITDGMYCDVNATSSNENVCCAIGEFWDPSYGCIQFDDCCADPCSYNPFEGNGTSKSGDKWWNASKACLEVNQPQPEACVSTGFEFGEMTYRYKNVSSYWLWVL
jgi:hypothetical protein